MFRPALLPPLAWAFDTHTHATAAPSTEWRCTHVKEGERRGTSTPTPTPTPTPKSGPRCTSAPRCVQTVAAGRWQIQAPGQVAAAVRGPPFDGLGLHVQKSASDVRARAPFRSEERGARSAKRTAYYLGHLGQLASAASMRQINQGTGRISLEYRWTGGQIDVASGGYRTRRRGLSFKRNCHVC